MSVRPKRGNDRVRQAAMIKDRILAACDQSTNAVQPGMCRFTCKVIDLLMSRPGSAGILRAIADFRRGLPQGA